MWWSVAFDGLFLLVPLVACSVWPRAFQFVLVVGVVAAGIEWALAYRSSQVEHGGDWQPGGDLLAFTGFFAVLYFAVWLVFSLLGVIVGRKLLHNA